MIQQKEIPTPSQKDIDRFWSKVLLTANDDLCWEWKGGTEKDGYGRIKIKGSMIKAHRFSYFLRFNIDPKVLGVLHHCDNPLCTNPKHLFLGTNADNVIDCVRKGRQAKGEKNGKYTKPEKTLRGSKHGSAKLTEDDVVEIRGIYSSGHFSLKELAKEYNISDSLIFNIVKNIGWKHVS